MAGLLLLGLAAGCGAGSSPGGFGAGKLDDLSDASVVGTLDFDAPVTGEFLEDGQRFAWEFGAARDSAITLEVTQLGSSRGLDTTLTVFGRSGASEAPWTPIAFDDESGFGQLSRIRALELGTGFTHYLVVVATADGTAGGRFRLQLVCDTGNCALPDLDLKHRIPPAWRELVSAQVEADSFRELESFLEREYAGETVFPQRDDIFAALEITAPEDVKVVLLGQDPYHGAGQAHGLAFSVQDGVPIPPSLRNVFKELESDLGVAAPESGNLTRWAEHGVLLLNTSLTVREKQPASHAGRGWEQFTDGIIDSMNQRDDGVVFLLWGSHARAKKARIDLDRHVVIESAHPSPLSASHGFFGSQPFSKANAALESLGRAPIDWSL
jgi:uracil-DNA glycosylase